MKRLRVVEFSPQGKSSTLYLNIIYNQTSQHAIAFKIPNAHSTSSVIVKCDNSDSLSHIKGEHDGWNQTPSQLIGTVEIAQIIHQTRKSHLPPPDPT